MPTNRGEALIVRPPVRRVSRPCPALQDAGWLPGQLFGLVNEGRMAPQLTHGLEDHRQIELPSAVIRLTVHEAATDLKVQGRLLLSTMAIDSGGSMGVCW